MYKILNFFFFFSSDIVKCLGFAQSIQLLCLTIFELVGKFLNQQRKSLITPVAVRQELGHLGSSPQTLNLVEDQHNQFDSPVSAWRLKQQEYTWNLRFQVEVNILKTVNILKKKKKKKPASYTFFFFSTGALGPVPHV